jgi:formamidopyrimidine-DNA glycosylase
VPELPDVTVYVERIAALTVGAPLEDVRLASPFLVRTFDPPIAEARGRRVLAVRRLGKRIVLAFDGDLFLAIHLMVAGRFRWRERGAKIPGKIGLAAFDFPSGTLLLTEASTKKRAALHLVRGETALSALDRGGLEPLGATAQSFAAALRSESHTLKRALTDPRIFAGVGNAYSDEILHRARLSPVRLTGALSDEEVARLHRACADVLTEWTDRLRRETGDSFPEKVTAFREGMAVHGRYKEPCPVCGAPVQRIRYAENETNYCAKCQTGGKLLADRALSRLLKGDWPRSLEEWEAHTAERRGS